MSGRSLKKSSLFLIELTFAVLFFAVCAAVCMRLFAAAKNNTDYSRDLTNASVRVQSAAELFKGENGDLNALAAVLGGIVTGGELRVAYDGGWNVTDNGENAEFILTVLTVSDTKGLLSAEANVTRAGGESLFSVRVKLIKEQTDG